MTVATKFNEAALVKHSFDLVYFPMYLKRNVAPMVRIEWCTNAQDADLMGFYVNDAHNRTSRFVKLVANPDGIATDSDGFFSAVHTVFQSVSTPSVIYIGFTRCGPPVFAPLFALAMQYKKYGRGLYEPGQVLPTPCDFLTSEYVMRLR